MPSGDAIASVIIASAQSVAKVFVIGGVGGLAVCIPRKAPFLPRSLVSSVARFCFHSLTLPLIYSTIAIAVSIDTVGDYWFLIVGGWVVLLISYLVATLLAQKWCCLPIHNPCDFHALRVAATFPNIVALPILIFPSLCEFKVVQEGYAQDYDVNNNNNDGEGDSGGGEMNTVDLQRECIAQSTTMIFCYFFAWSLAFWSFGHPQLMNAATARNRQSRTIDNDNDTNESNESNTDHRLELSNSSDNNTNNNDNNNLDTPAITPSPSTDNSDNDDHQEHHEQQQEEEDMEKGMTIDNAQQQQQQQLYHLDTDPSNEQQVNEEKRSSSSHNITITISYDSTKISPPETSSSSREQQQQQQEGEEGKVDDRDETHPQQTSDSDNNDDGGSSDSRRWWTSISKCLIGIWTALKQTCTSPGFIAMVLAFITACIPPLQRALFEPGGPLRFFGSAMETLGQASSPLSTMVVAASLVPPSKQRQRQNHGHRQRSNDNNQDDNNQTQQDDEGSVRQRRRSTMIIDERPGMTDPNFGPYQRRRRQQRSLSLSSSSRFMELRRSLQSSSLRVLKAVPRSSPEMRRLHIWFILSRLIITPAVVVGLILGLDCSGSTVLNNVPNLAKLVIVVNSALPGALIVVVLLKSNDEMADTAAAVSKVYLPSYLLSIVTIAAWTAVGLYITIPNEEGNTFCQA